MAANLSNRSAALEPNQRPDALPEHLAPEVRERLATFHRQFGARLVSCVYWRNRAPWRLEERRVGDSFLLFPVRGTLTLQACGRRYSVPPGRFVMLAPGEPHALELAEGYARLEQISLHGEIGPVWGQPLIACFATPVGTLTARAEAFAFLRRLTCLAGHDREAAEAAAQAWLANLLAREIVSRDDVALPDRQADVRIVQALETIERRFREPVTVDWLAAEAALSPTQFRKLFRAATGASPKAYLQERRLREAARLLRGTLLPVGAIAREAGFASEHYFSRAFRRRYGCSPTERRRGAGRSV